MKDLIGILMMFWIFTIKAQIINDFEVGICQWIPYGPLPMNLGGEWIL